MTFVVTLFSSDQAGANQTARPPFRHPDARRATDTHAQRAMVKAWNQIIPGVGGCDYSGGWKSRVPRSHGALLRRRGAVKGIGRKGCAKMRARFLARLPKLGGWGLVLEMSYNAIGQDS